MKGNIIGILVMSLSLGAPLAGQDYEIKSTEEVRAVVGKNVTLPCQTEPPKDLQSLTVEWKNNESFVHHYRTGQDDHDLQQPQYTNRTILSHEDLVKGNLSLKLLHVQLSDQGNYTCSVVKLSNKTKVTSGHVSLIVSDGAEDGNDDSGKKTGTQLSLGAKIGIGISVACVILIPGGVAVYLWKKREARAAQGGEPGGQPHEIIELLGMSRPGGEGGVA
ncbi:myelin-oligodendrocyte glycoprotein-like isoform X2 [Myripristis murdjan]|uniref:myelin-oligodendrocyte glycoprotein-like isoform X2 n=1 Tax=Myripristis murdjan TaxID=586833 RepID=UPI0011762BD4|nr:myelin-oligodendrocyte glycoprotein-like isoform X2 [Myripristis murdjan]